MLELRRVRPSLVLLPVSLAVFRVGRVMGPWVLSKVTVRTGERSRDVSVRL